MAYTTLGLPVTGTPITSAWGTVARDDLTALESRTPWIVEIIPLFGGDSHVNWNSVALQGAFGVTALSSVGVQNDEVTWNSVALSAGTWTIRLGLVVQNNLGIITVQLDGVTVGTIDCYIASGVGSSSIGTIAGVTVAADGRKALKLKTATKNASSSGYGAHVSLIQFRRTA